MHHQLQQHRHHATTTTAQRGVPASSLRGDVPRPSQRCTQVAHTLPPQQQQQQQPQQTAVKQQAEPEAEPAYKYSDAVNQFLGQFLPSSRAAREELSVDWGAPKARGLSMTELAARVEAGLAARQWFVTGDVDAAVFSDTFAFQDDSVATSGIKSYATGVRKLFDQETSKVELVSVTPRPEAQPPAIEVVWRLEGRVNLPLKPRIKPYVVTTTLGLDADGLICSQLDEFSIPGWELLLCIFLGDGFGAPPAPPVEELRAAAAAGTLPPPIKKQKGSGQR